MSELTDYYLTLMSIKFMKILMSQYVISIKTQFICSYFEVRVKSISYHRWIKRNIISCMQEVIIFSVWMFGFVMGTFNRNSLAFYNSNKMVRKFLAFLLFIATVIFSQLDIIDTAKALIRVDKLNFKGSKTVKTRMSYMRTSEMEVFFSILLLNSWKQTTENWYG